MKKIIVTLLAIATLALTLCSCATFKCMNCGKGFSKGDSGMYVKYFGQEITACGDCVGKVGDIF